MSSRVTMSRFPDGSPLRIVAEIDERDLAELRLDGIDRQVVSSEITEPADILQSAEIIFRRMRQQGLA